MHLKIFKTLLIAGCALTALSSLNDANSVPKTALQAISAPPPTVFSSVSKKPAAISRLGSESELEANAVL